MELPPRSYYAGLNMSDEDINEFERALLDFSKPGKDGLPLLSADAVIDARESTHGDYTLQAQTALFLKNDLRREETEWRGLTPPQKESLDMIMVKVSRILHGNPNEPDHWLDIAGYATLVHQILTKKA